MVTAASREAAGGAGARRRIAVVAGFSTGLAAAIADVFSRHGLEVQTVETLDGVCAEIETPVPELVVVSARCRHTSVTALVERLGRPRSTRVVVLLTVPDPEAERSCRAAGIEAVLTMPVDLRTLMVAGRLPAG